MLAALEAQDAGARRAAVLAFVAARIVVGDAVLQPFAARLSPMHAQLVQVRRVLMPLASMGCSESVGSQCCGSACLQTWCVSCHCRIAVPEAGILANKHEACCCLVGSVWLGQASQVRHNLVLLHQHVHPSAGQLFCRVLWSCAAGQIQEGSQCVGRLCI